MAAALHCLSVSAPHSPAAYMLSAWAGSPCQASRVQRNSVQAAAVPAICWRGCLPCYLVHLCKASFGLSDCYWFDISVACWTPSPGFQGQPAEAIVWWCMLLHSCTACYVTAAVHSHMQSACSGCCPLIYAYGTICSRSCSSGAAAVMCMLLCMDKL